MTEYTPDVTQRIEHPSTPIDWSGLENMPPKDFVCGHCGRDVTAEKGYRSAGDAGLIYICHRCKRPSFFANDSQVPGPTPGAEIEHLPEAVEELWGELRRAMSVRSWTLVVMACRKMLMNVAVDQGAKEGLKYSAYVDWIAKNKLAPGNMEWIERIRDIGGEANHVIAASDETDALDVVSFLEHLLRTVYEFPGKMRKKVVGDSA